MLNLSAGLAMSTSVLKALPGKLDIKRLSPSILYVTCVLNYTLLLLLVSMAWKCHNHRSTHSILRTQAATTHNVPADVL